MEASSLTALKMKIEAPINPLDMTIAHFLPTIGTAYLQEASENESEIIDRYVI